MKRGERTRTIVSLLEDGVVTNVFHYGLLEQTDMETAVLAFVKAGHEVRVVYVDVHEGGD